MGILVKYLHSEFKQKIAEITELSNKINMHLCTWETAFTQEGDCLQRVVANGLIGNEVDALFNKENAQEALEERVRGRLESLETLPTLPAPRPRTCHNTPDGYGLAGLVAIRKKFRK